MHRSSLALALLGLASGCGPGVPARFVGQSAEPVVTAEQIAQAEGLPGGYRLIGQVSSSCTADQRTRDIDDVWLKDVECSEQLLVAALYERAAGVGGDLLVSLECIEDAKGSGECARVERGCSAWVARATQAKRTQRALTSRSDPGVTTSPYLERPPRQLVRSGPAADAWKILITLLPTGPHQAARAPRPPHLVEETAVMPASQVPFGDIVARCQGGCEADSVRDAVLLAAARVGARTVSDIGCVQGKPGWICTGSAAVYEVDPDTYRKAR